MNIAIAVSLIISGLAVGGGMMYLFLSSEDKQKKEEETLRTRTMDGSNPPPGKDRPPKP